MNISKNRPTLASPALLMVLMLLAVGVVTPAFAQESNDRLESMTGVWTGPPLDKDGVPAGSMLRGDIIVPIPVEGEAVEAAPPTPWPDGVVPFQFDANVTAANRAAMLVAMDDLMKGADADKLHLAFLPRGTQADYVHIRNSNVNNSWVGTIGGSQIMNIFNWNIKTIMAHEFGHALGLWHEQSRPDRDTYVTIHLGNVTAGKEHNFNKEPDWVPNSTYTTYDFTSMMHYGPTAFSYNGNATITANAGYNGSQMGQRTFISTSDYYDLYNIPTYGGGGSQYVDHRNLGAQAGTLSNPWVSVVNGAAQNVASQNPNIRSRLWVQGGTYLETGALVGPQRILAIPGTGSVMIGN